MKIETEFTNTPEKDAGRPTLREAADDLALELKLGTYYMRTWATMLMGADYLEVWYHEGLFISRIEKESLPKEWMGYPVTYRFDVKPAVALNV